MVAVITIAAATPESNLEGLLMKMGLEAAIAAGAR
jgi:hypothetical protein